ncbi:MAG: chorismate mutase [Alphaproteobacteria bacterium]|nr:chorismate mutase [Alphaproteobacteria bacterium]
MSNTPDDLAALRREIDSIDEQLHDLLMRRGEVVTEIGRRKAADGQVSFRPAREAQLLRRLLARHRGPLPAETIVRVWREIIASAIRLQGELIVGYCPLEGHGSALRLANGNFGLNARTARLETADAVVDAVAEGDVSVGLVPLPQSEGASGWWNRMPDAPSVHVVARLPWPMLAGADPEPEAATFVLASSEPEDSGDDRSVLMIRCRDAVEGDTLVTAFVANGIVVDPQSVVEDQQASAGCVYIVETEGFLGGADTRLRAAAESVGGAEVRWLGAFAQPSLSQNEMGAD